MGENMNVLYISNLTGNLFAGPNNSVPAQIKAQSKRDNVFWYNINDIKREEWKEIHRSFRNSLSGKSHQASRKNS